MMERYAEVLSFWFGRVDSAERGRPRACWFAKSDAFDAEIRTGFAALHEQACRGELSRWEATPLAALALIVVLDQFSRNLYRASPRAYAADAGALAIARRMLGRGFDTLLLPVERWFVYLPFEHAEDLAAQRRSLELFGRLSGDAGSSGALDYARRHFEIVARFGRFPHRNAVLGRKSTPAESEFLKLPGSSF